jgi:hypothetical protein
MLDALESKGCAPLVRLHAACMAIRPFYPLFWAKVEECL